jgi:hypothetical protein
VKGSFGVDFRLMAKVAGLNDAASTAPAAQLFRWLRARAPAAPGGVQGADTAWNFEKCAERFLVLFNCYSPPSPLSAAPPARPRPLLPSSSLAHPLPLSPRRRFLIDKTGRPVKRYPSAMVASELEHDVYAELTKIGAAAAGAGAGGGASDAAAAAAGTGTAGAGATAGQTAATH